MLGLNHKENLHDAAYDIQTQDLGPEKRQIETRVYREGKILDTVCSSYPEQATLPALQECLRHQHDRACTKVREGTYELLFLWLSRGLIALESRNYSDALDCLESVLAMEETHSEAGACLDRIRSDLTESPELLQELAERYQSQVRALQEAGRLIEARRKEVLLARLCLPRAPGKGEGLLCMSADGGSNAHALPPPCPPGRHWPRAFRWHATVALAGLLLVASLGLIARKTGKADRDSPLASAAASIEQGRALEAREVLGGVLQEKPASEELLRLIWKTFDLERDYDRAVPLLESLARRHDTPAVARRYLAEAYRMQDRLTDAVEQYRTAREQNAPGLLCAIGAALCHLERREPQAAIDLLEQTVKEGSEDFRIDYCLGTAYQQLGRPGRAAIHFAQALNRKGDSPAIYRSLSACLRDLHQGEKALALQQQADLLEAQAEPSEHGVARVARAEQRSRSQGSAPGPSGTGIQPFPFSLF
ncbi:MAG: tetratricopeptide repeat protein [bacterium]